MIDPERFERANAKIDKYLDQLVQGTPKERELAVHFMRTFCTESIGMLQPDELIRTTLFLRDLAREALRTDIQRN